MKIEQQLINVLAPVREMLEKGQVIRADRRLGEIIDALAKSLKP